jgi:hypothetical protein
VQRDAGSYPEGVGAPTLDILGIAHWVKIVDSASQMAHVALNGVSMDQLDAGLSKGPVHREGGEIGPEERVQGRQSLELG